MCYSSQHPACQLLLYTLYGILILRKNFIVYGDGSVRDQLLMPLPCGQLLLTGSATITVLVGVGVRYLALLCTQSWLSICNQNLPISVHFMSEERIRPPIPCLQYSDSQIWPQTRILVSAVWPSQCCGLVVISQMELDNSICSYGQEVDTDPA